MKKLIFVFFLLLNATLWAQLKLIKATKQPWAGGMQGYHGNYYNAEFKAKAKDSITIDSLYLNGSGYAVIQSSKEINQPNWYTASLKKKKVITLFFKESFYPCTIPDFGANPSEEKLVEKPSRTFTGEALIIYNVNGKKKKLIVAKFENLETINYP
jgi:hypothetical protein